jgi:hypothetical protein
MLIEVKIHSDCDSPVSVADLSLSGIDRNKDAWATGNTIGVLRAARAHEPRSCIMFASRSMNQRDLCI